MRLSARSVIINIRLLKTFYSVTQKKYKTCLITETNPNAWTSFNPIIFFGNHFNSQTTFFIVYVYSFTVSHSWQMKSVKANVRICEANFDIGNLHSFQKEKVRILHLFPLLNKWSVYRIGTCINDRTFTLICDVEPWLVLWIVAVEEEAGLVGGAEQRLGDEWTAEPVDDRARLQRSTANL